MAYISGDDIVWLLSVAVTAIITHWIACAQHVRETNARNVKIFEEVERMREASHRLLISARDYGERGETSKEVAASWIRALLLECSDGVARAIGAPVSDKKQ